MHVSGENIGATILKAMRAIESANPDTLPGVFGDGDWGNKNLLPDATLADLIEHFSTQTLSVANVPEDELGNAYEYLIKKFADDSGKVRPFTDIKARVADSLIMSKAPLDSFYQANGKRYEKKASCEVGLIQAQNRKLADEASKAIAGGMSFADAAEPAAHGRPPDPPLPPPPALPLLPLSPPQAASASRTAATPLALHRITTSVYRRQVHSIHDRQKPERRVCQVGLPDFARARVVTIPRLPRENDLLDDHRPRDPLVRGHAVGIDRRDVHAPHFPHVVRLTLRKRLRALLASPSTLVSRNRTCSRSC